MICLKVTAMHHDTLQRGEELQRGGSVANESTLLVLIKYDFLLKPGNTGKTAVLLRKKVISFIS